MKRCQEAKQDEKVDQLLMIATYSSSKCSLRVVKFCNLLEYGPLFLINLWLELLSQLHDV
jgi:hypothetical protein